MIRCPLLRRRMAESRSLRTAIRAMIEDRFSPEEIAIGLKCELSVILGCMYELRQERRIAERLA